MSLNSRRLLRNSIAFALILLTSVAYCLPPAEENPEGKTFPFNALDHVYQFDAEVKNEWPEADVILMASGEQLELQARIETHGELDEDWVESSRRIRWEASAGEVTFQTRGGEVLEGQGWFLPPERSQLVTLTAWCELGFRRLTPEGDFERQTMRREQTFKILSPEVVMTLDKGHLKGYELGEYLDPLDHGARARYDITTKWPLLHPERYQLPRDFYRVEADWKDYRISEHLRLGDWVTDYPWYSLGMPQYVALDLNLVRKLEDLVALMESDGYSFSRIVPIYGFRSPAFNLGTALDRPDYNLKMPFSMHQYGRAIDMIFDEDGDLMMDDLNEDGVIDIHDAAVVMHYVNQLDREYRQAGRFEMVGGAGIYTDHDFYERPVQSPYIHVDTRGFLDTNGQLVRWVSGHEAHDEGKWPDGTTVRFGSIDKRGYDR